MTAARVENFIVTIDGAEAGETGRTVRDEGLAEGSKTC
jgi:predicted RNA-binding protein with TRAM domain